MSSIEKMLEYQKVDMSYVKLLNEVNNSEASKKKNAYKAATQGSLETLTKMDGIAKSTMDIIVKNKSRFEEISKQIDEICAEIEQESDDKQLDYYIKQLDKLSQTLEDMEKETARENRELADASYEYPKEWEKAKKSKTLFVKYNQEYAELVNTRTEEANSIKKQLAVMEKELDRELLDKYKKIRASKRPVFVPFRNPNCGGCGMEVAQNVINKLSEGRKIHECPNCGRIIYVKD